MTNSEKLDKLLDRTARIEEQQVAIKEDVGELKEHVKTQNGRVGKLERWKSKIVGGLILLSFVVGWLIKLVS